MLDFLLTFLLVISNLSFGVSILLYFYFKEMKNKDRAFDRFQEVIRIHEGLARENLKTLTEVSKSKDTLFQKTLIEYLKHNEKLEKMILPQPVTRKAVEEILSSGPLPVANEIEKTENELEQDNLNDILGKLPITRDTKVAFEDGQVDEAMDGLSEEIDQDDTAVS